jgi:hypothetical protein
MSFTRIFFLDVIGSAVGTTIGFAGGWLVLKWWLG